MKRNQNHCDSWIQFRIGWVMCFVHLSLACFSSDIKENHIDFDVRFSLIPNQKQSN